MSVKVKFLQPSSIPFIVFAARGAHEPFSISPTVLFLNPLSVRWFINSLIKGKISALYVVVARTILPYLNASSTASAISSLARSVTTTFGQPLAFNLSARSSTAFLV